MGLTAGVLDVFGTVIDDCHVSGIASGAVINSSDGEDTVAGGFAGYGDVSQIKNSSVTDLKQVYSDETAGGFIGRTNMNYLVEVEADSPLVQLVLRILNALLSILRVNDLEDLNLLGLDLGILNLKLLSDGDLLYVNLFGLKIGAKLLDKADWVTYRTESNAEDRDQRMSSSTMKQAKRYEPTEQKIIFHCNSQQVWHNVHIEFFEDANGEIPVGQQFPGYMMEPYAYAGSDYRLSNGYLTYELTIPAEAKYFRVNNGIDLSDIKGSFDKTEIAQSPYAYRTAITALKNTNGIKNFDNYFKLNSIERYDCSNSANAQVDINARSFITGRSGENNVKTYTAQTAESDYDYIYFEAPNSWGTHIYAYFYGGGNLREDNWQRACYSVWPGITPDGTEFTAYSDDTKTETVAKGHSDIYTYPILAENPDTVFTDKNSQTTVYKFKVPMGERKNYSKVIFNNGLKSKVSTANGADGKTHETGAISYIEGFLYTASGASRQHFESNKTIQYALRGDLLYIKNTANWDDIHIQFYNSSGSQILQSGKGYLMRYAGKLTQDGTDYFSIPIPKDAAKFSLSNGKSDYSYNTGTGNTLTTPKTDIPRLDPILDTDNITTADATRKDAVYELTSNVRSELISPQITVTAHEDTSQVSSSYIPTPSSPRGDFIYLKDTAHVLSSLPNISFYETASSTNPAAVSVQVLKLQESPAGTAWYSVGIPTNVSCFTINGGSQKNTIYPKSHTSMMQVNATPADMYYETVSNTTLTLLWSTFTSDADDLSDEVYPDETGTTENGQRGDHLYLVVSESERTDWSGMTVTFYDASGSTIENNNGDTEITAKSLGLLTKEMSGSAPVDGVTTHDDNAAGYWYRVSIPLSAVSFTVSNGDGTKVTSKAEIFEKREKISRYRRDYTIGDMQYRILNTSAKLLYPVFTEDEEYTLNVGDQTISSQSYVTKADASGISDYAEASAAAANVQNDTLSPLPVLYSTDTNTITYSWDSGGSYSVTYQPEDRYGYIRDAADTADADCKNAGSSLYSVSDNNFITIQTTLSDPYIMFYRDDSALSPIGDTTTMASNGISLVKAHVSDDASANDQASPYQIRLPKDARAFRIGNGASGAQGNVIPLYETVNVKSSDGTVWTSGDEPHIQITGYHHAGTTFTVGNDGNVSAKTLRTGRSIPTRMITDPLYPRTDNDYLFLTDVGNRFAPNGSVYAYFYGGADGEYTAWPGIRASVSDQADLVYTDNDGNRVYRFRLPDISDGIYPFVIFNNGSAADGTRKVTQKIDIMETSAVQEDTVYLYTAGGMNYRADASSDSGIQHCGTYDNAAGFVNAYPTNAIPKQAEKTEYYSSNKQIYLVNNGTNQLNGSAARDLLDDMHIVFYRPDKQPILGDHAYLPDKLLSCVYTDEEGSAGAGDVYSISVPQNAAYFRITNGTKDGSVYHNMRQSELKRITANGLYRFVPSADAPSGYIEEPVVPADLQTAFFLLELINEIKTDDEDPPASETYDVKLATVVTGEDGKQEKIIWLKPNDAETDIDTRYLNHDLADIWTQEGDRLVTEVRLKVDTNKCFWIETKAPDGYLLNIEKHPVTEAVTTITDKRMPIQITLKKTAKDTVGNKPTGSPLSGARFVLYSVDKDKNFMELIPLVKFKNKVKYEYKPTDADAVTAMLTSGVYETDGNGNAATLTDHNIYSSDPSAVYNVNKALVTGNNGKFKIDNLPLGDYCLEEIKAPSGYDAADPNTGENRKAFFSVGANTTVKNLTLSDEMRPAYLMLYEHIDQWRHDEWGNPTFVFVIRQTGYYQYDADGTASLLPVSNGKTIRAALTVDDDGKFTAGLDDHTDPAYNYHEWYQESTNETENGVLEYLGQFHINEDGAIRLEPGTYEITRIPVSRYEFVENTYALDSSNTQSDDYIAHRSEVEKMTVTILPEETAIVHYYDRVEEYGKNSQSDEEINRFYVFENSKNKTIKGFRIDDYHQIGTETVGDKDADTIVLPSDSSCQLNIPVQSLVIYLIYADGTEERMNAEMLAELRNDLLLTYTYHDTSGDKESFGNASPPDENDFMYDENTKTITVNHAQKYENGVYTLNAVWKGFKTAFDLVFLRSS